jgi:hypothetical protein
VCNDAFGPRVPRKLSGNASRARESQAAETETEGADGEVRTPLGTSMRVIPVCPRARRQAQVVARSEGQGVRVWTRGEGRNVEQPLRLAMSVRAEVV